MQFDFHTQYSGLSNVELLKIVLQKEIYNENAVVAAKDILAQRVVTEEESAEAEANIEYHKLQEQQKSKHREKFISNAIHSIRGIFIPVGKPVTYYLRAFSVISFAIWLIHIISLRNYFWPFFEIDFGLIFILLTEVYFLLMLFWIYRLNKKGWMLTMAYYAVQASLVISDFFKPGSHFTFQTYTPTLPVILITGVILYFFNRKEVRIVFGVSSTLYRDVLIICSILFFLTAVFILYT